MYDDDESEDGIYQLAGLLEWGGGGMNELLDSWVDESLVEWMDGWMLYEMRHIAKYRVREGSGVR